MNLTYDSNGLLVNNGDGGDTAGREGDYWFYEGLTKGPDIDNEFGRVLKLLQASPGIFVRNSGQPQYNIPSDFSRDQATPLMLAMGLYEEYQPYKLMMKNVVKNYFRFQNNDWASPEDISIMIRSFKLWYLYPLLFIGDLFTMGESVIRCFAALNDTSDDINHTLILLQSQNKYATPITWLARKIYKLWRPGGIQAAWDSYFAPNSCKFNELYSSLIAKM